jgi:5S rRNA maturation endonuclease (ribonuclease M5)
MAEPIPEMMSRIDLRLLYSDKAPKNNRAIFTQCPKHADMSRPNLAVYPTNTYCFACGYHEKATEHLLRVLNLSNSPGALLHALGALINNEIRLHASGKRREEPLEPSLVDYYMSLMKPHIMEHLLARYGLNYQSVVDNKIGFMPGKNAAITIPVMNASRRKLINIRFRSMLEKPTLKYWGVSGHNSLAWYRPAGVGVINKSATKGYVVIAEGEFDALALRQLGFYSVSPTNGAMSLLGECDKMLDELRGLHVYLAFDQDEPGRYASIELQKKLNDMGLGVTRITWPNVYAKDASELLALGYTRPKLRWLWDYNKTTDESFDCPLDTPLDTTSDIAYNAIGY